jgi:hypothetical protein
LQVVARRTGDLVGDAYTVKGREDKSAKAQRAACALEKNGTSMINRMVEVSVGAKQRKKGEGLKRLPDSFHMYGSAAVRLLRCTTNIS